MRFRMFMQKIERNSSFLPGFSGFDPWKLVIGDLIEDYFTFEFFPRSFKATVFPPTNMETIFFLLFLNLCNY